jgi:small-conductance mechanosensitive channel
MAACAAMPAVASAQAQGASGQAHGMNQILVRDLDMMTGIMADVKGIIGRGNLTAAQRQQAMNILGQLGAVMQQMAAAGEIEGWQQTRRHNQLDEMKKQLEALKHQLDGRVPGPR